MRQEEIQKLFDYDNNTGNLIYKIATRKNSIGNVAGTKARDGSVVIGIGYNLYRAHRLIWLWYYGNPVPKVIDHKDGNPSNNRLDNLRSANDSKNLANSKVFVTNTSGIKGVHWNKVNKKWDAYVTHNYTKYHLGSFSDMEAAKLARQKRFEELFGEFANHDRRI